MHFLHTHVVIFLFYLLTFWEGFLFVVFFEVCLCSPGGIYVCINVNSFYSGPAGEKGERGSPGIGERGQRGMPGPPGRIFFFFCTCKRTH